MNHYIAILHAGIESAAGGLQLGFQYDEPYCTYFKNHTSSWSLQLSDPLIARIKEAAAVNIVVDGRVSWTGATAELLRRPVPIQIPAGTGRHTWKLEIK